MNLAMKKLLGLGVIVPLIVTGAEILNRMDIVYSYLLYEPAAMLLIGSALIVTVRIARGMQNSIKLLGKNR